MSKYKTDKFVIYTNSYYFFLGKDNLSVVTSRAFGFHRRDSFTLTSRQTVMQTLGRPYGALCLHNICLTDTLRIGDGRRIARAGAFGLHYPQARRTSELRRFMDQTLDKNKMNTKKTNSLVRRGFGSMMEPSSNSLVLISQATSAVLWSVALWLGYSLVLQQDNADGNVRECETCGGSGLVDCMCTRWSDGDRKGCSSCQGTLKTTCHACRGGGTAVPIVSKVYIKNEQDYRM